MKINPEYKQEYEASLAALKEATKALHDYLEVADAREEKGVSYLAQEEGALLEAEQDAIRRHREASKKYFGDQQE